MGVDRQADVLGVGAHLEGVHRLGDQLAGVDVDVPRTEHARVCVHERRRLVDGGHLTVHAS